MLNRIVSAAVVAYGLSAVVDAAAVTTYPAATNVGAPVSETYPPMNSK
jgi:hypothetical protein